MSQLLTPAELANYLQVAEATLADYRYRGRGPKFIKVGRLVRYKPEDVDEWLTVRSDRRNIPSSQMSGQASNGSVRQFQPDDPLASKREVTGVGAPDRTLPPGERGHDGA